MHIQDPGDRFFGRMALARVGSPFEILLIGLAGGLVGIILRLALHSVYGGAHAFILYMPGVLIAALWGGRAAGFTAIIVAAASSWLLMLPTGMSGAAPAQSLVGTAAFILTGAFGVVMASSLRRAMGSLNRSVNALKASASILDESEARFRLVSEDAPVMLWMSDEHGDCVYINKAQREFWGTPETPAAFDWKATLHPDDASRVIQAAVEAAAEGQGFEILARYRRHDGQWRTLKTQARPRLDSSGRSFGMIGVNLDITDPLLLEASLRENEAELTAMVEQAAAGIVKATLDGCILKVNDRFCEMMGYGRDEIIGMSTRDVSHADDVEPTRAAVDAASRSAIGTKLEKRYVRKDRSVFWALTSIRLGQNEADREPWIMGVVADISDAKAAEAALRESEQRFRMLADTAPSPIWLTDAEGTMEFANAALADFFGVSSAALIGDRWKEALHPQDVERINHARDDRRLLLEPIKAEARFRNARHEWRWMKIDAKPRFDLENRFLGYVGMAFDITESRQALDRLARDERRQAFLLALTDRLRDINDPERIMTEVESALGDALGADRVGYGEIDEDQREIAYGRDWTAGIASARGRWALDAFGTAIMDDLAAGRIVRIEDVRHDPRTAVAAAAFDAIQTQALVRAPLVRNGRLRAFLYVHASAPRPWTDAEVGLIEEVAERTWAEIERARAQTHLKESESRFRDIADTAPVLIWVTRADRQRAFVNQAYVDYIGGDYETARTTDWRTYVHPDDQDRIVIESQMGEASGNPFSMEARYRHRTGEYRWLRSFSRPRMDAQGQVIGFVGVAFDINEAKKAEQDLKRINELLEERVTEALAEKAHAEQELMHAQRMEAVGRLTGGVAHDFNNLLTVIIGALDMMLKSPDDAARRRKMGEAALSAARRGERLTHQLLAFSRRQALRPEPCDLNALIRESEPLLRRGAGEAVDFRLRLKRGRAMARVDAAQFEAALLNLVVNARDAMGGEGRLVVRTETCTLDARYGGELTPGDYLCVVVSDSGPGIDPHILNRVFEPFFTTKAVGKGTGLGLSQVYGFARQSGGDVRIANASGEGAEVRLYLPPLPARSAPRPIPVAETAPTAALQGRRILLVEDDQAVAGLAADQLAALGLDVVTAENADQALLRLDDGGVDLVLTDVVMPGGMNGVALANEIARRRPGMPIILTSGYVGDDVDQTLGDAPWPLLPKPYDADDLKRCLNAALSKN